jgi:rare lipoprotein A
MKISRACRGRAILAACVLLVGATGSASAQCGRASWYSMGKVTANGERMNAAGLTAAHRTLPFGTKLKVTNKANGKAVVVRVNDRGPFIKGRVLDLTRGAAKALGFVESGLTSVCMVKAG